jgi:hypothetical protein
MEGASLAGIPPHACLQNGWRGVPMRFVPAAASGVRWQAVFRATPLFPASPHMQTPRNGVESQNRQKCLNIRPNKRVVYKGLLISSCTSWPSW